MVVGRALNIFSCAVLRMCRDLARYKHFLALGSDKEAVAAAKAMKAKGDFTTPGNDYDAIAAAKAAGTPADAFLSTNELTDAAKASA